MAVKGSMYGLQGVPIAVETQRRRILIGLKKIKLHLIHTMSLAHLDALITRLILLLPDCLYGRDAYLIR